jgi:nucleoside-diphosphate-sugar epimerase
MTKKRIFFTGGSGKAGKHVIPYLPDQGHRVMNVDLVRLDYPRVDNLIADITDSGQMVNAMSSYAGLDELEPDNDVPQLS